MFDQLQANKGKNVVVELVNGRAISGTVLAVDQQFVRIETVEGSGNIPLQSVYILWEPLKRSLTRENMDEIAEQLRDNVKQHYICPTAQGFNCMPSYTCTPPHLCNAFTCQSGGFTAPQPACAVAPFTCRPPYVPPVGGCPTGIFCPVQFTGMLPPTAPTPGGCASPVTPSQPQFGCPFGITGAFPGMPGASASPSEIQADPVFCRPHFGGCGNRFGGCGFRFGEPCSFQFGEPCSFRFGEPCSFQFGQPCSFQFGQPCVPFPFGGSQCGTLGGFTCGGQQFFGLVGSK